MLASRLSTSRGVDDIRILLESAKDKADKIPEQIINRSKNKYLNGVKEAFGIDSRRVQINTSGSRDEMKLPVWRGIIKGRSTILHRLKSLEIARLGVEKAECLNCNRCLTTGTGPFEPNQCYQKLFRPARFHL